MNLILPSRWLGISTLSTMCVWAGMMIGSISGPVGGASLGNGLGWYSAEPISILGVESRLPPLDPGLVLHAATERAKAPSTATNAIRRMMSDPQKDQEKIEGESTVAPRRTRGTAGNLV